MFDREFPLIIGILGPLRAGFFTAGGSPRARRAGPLAWPSPSGPPGRQWLRAQGWVPKMLSAERSLRSA